MHDGSVGPRGLAGIALLLAAGAACDDGVAPSPVASVEIASDSLVIEVFTQRTVTASSLDASGRTLPDRAPVWRSLTPETASVTPTGTVTAEGLGRALLVAEADQAADTLVVRVGAPSGALLTSADSFVVGEMSVSRLDATLRDPADRVIPGAVFAWTVEDTEVARVEADGTVTAVSLGTTSVTVRWEGQERSASLRVGAGFRAVFLGPNHACALRVDQRAYCWGSGGNGRLGVDPAQFEAQGLSLARPTAVQGDHRFSTLALGEHHTCGLDAGGVGWCWGANFEGALGAGSDDQVCAQGQLPCSDVPVRVAGSRTFVDLSTGEGHTCALTSGGEAYCWGLDHRGQVGSPPDGLVVPFVIEPRPVGGDLGFLGLSLGMSADQSHALDGEGRVQAWGRRRSPTSSLEDPACTEEHCFLPRPVLPELTFSALQVGRSAVCGRVDAGSVLCWDSYTTDPARPVTLIAPVAALADANGPDLMCALGSEGESQCWSSSGSLVAAPLAGGRPLRQITTGWARSLPVVCAVDDRRLLLCWANDPFGGEPERQPEPQD